MTYGYCRISTKKQNIERQERNIKAAYPEALICKEVYTGTKSDRKEWNKLLKALKPADTVVFDSVSRMSRNAEEGFETYERLYNAGVNLAFLKEPHINTDTYKPVSYTHLATSNEFKKVLILSQILPNIFFLFFPPYSFHFIIPDFPGCASFRKSS